VLIAESGLNSRDSIWLMAGRSTRLVVIPLLPQSCADLRRQATCGPWRWMSLTPRRHRQAIDLLLNNAGIGGPRGQTIGNIGYKAWARVLDVNTVGPMRVSEAFVDNVARSERKLIVTLTSGMGSLADNTSGGSIAYRSSKAAVNMVMRSLAIDLAPRGITCVVVNPGWVLTDMGGTHATMTPAESVTRLRRLIETLGPAQSGKFFNHDGREYPW
jgi:NAD(P)-dependent dehydrogenase (short-subunit alcohol dehydrogenase family)